MPFRRPGQPQPNGHIVRSNAEAALCDFLEHHAIAHEHEALAFDVQTDVNQWQTYIPPILLTQLRVGEKKIILQPIAAVTRGGGVRRLITFYQQYQTQYFVIVIARRSLKGHIYDKAYDVFVALEDFEPLGQFLVGLR